MALDTLGVGDIQNIIAGIVDAPAAQKIQLQKNVIPKLTTTQRNALTGADLYEGLTINNTTTHKLNFYNGTAWEAVTSA